MYRVIMVWQYSVAPLGAARQARQAVWRTMCIRVHDACLCCHMAQC